MSAIVCAFLISMLSAVPIADRRPLALSEVDDAARYLFESARDNRWSDAANQLQTLQQAAEDLPAGLAPADVVASMRRRIRELADAVPNHERVRSMEASNAVTQYVIGLSAAFEARVPAQVPRLSYLGRQLELGIAEDNSTVIERAKADIRQTWNELRPELERRQHAADVRRMTDIVVSLEVTKRVSDEAQLARAELDAASHLAAELR